MVINNFIKRLQIASHRGSDVVELRVRNEVRNQKENFQDVEDILRRFEIIAEKAEKAGLDGEFIYDIAYEEAYSL